MKIVFEGTEEQMENLKALIEHGDNDLPKMKEDYQTENLWSVEDVTQKYDCSDEMALNILESALTNDATMEQIWFAIDHHAEDFGVDIYEENK